MLMGVTLFPCYGANSSGKSAREPDPRLPLPSFAPTLVSGAVRIRNTETLVPEAV